MSIFKRSQATPEPELNPVEALDTHIIRQAEDGSEILYGLARELEAADAQTGYVTQIRDAAHAIRKLTKLHSAAGSGEEDSVFGAFEHASEINSSLRPWR